MYHADFVTGQYITPGDEVVAFLLAAAPGAGDPGYAPTQASYEYRVASLPLFGQFVEGGSIKVDEQSPGAQYTMACQLLLPKRRNTKEDDEEPAPESIQDLVEQSPPLAFLLPDTFRMLVSLAECQKAFDPLPVALKVYQRLRELLATPKGEAFLKLQAELKNDEKAFILASVRNREEAAASPLGVRLKSAKEAFGVSAYERFEEVAKVVQRLNTSRWQEDPFTGEEIELPAPLYIFSTNYSGRCVSPVLSPAFGGTRDVEPVLEGLLQIQQVDFALNLLGRLWEPSLYMGDTQFEEAGATYAAHLCATSLSGVRANADAVARAIVRHEGNLHRYDADRLEQLRILLPTLKLAAAELQTTLDAIEKLG